MSTPNTLPLISGMSGIPPDKYGTTRTNYDKRIMALYKFDEKPLYTPYYALKEGQKNNFQERSEYDKMMLKYFTPSNY